MAHLRCDVFADSLGLSTSLTVLLPQAAAGRIGMAGAARAGDPPVLWLLHGLSDDDTTWVRRTSIERYASALGLAVVMPQVHRSYYLDGVHTGAYWTWISEELPTLVHGMFRLSQRREDTFVAGLSMGGYGAMRLALLQPDRFAAAASMSGALDLVRLRGLPDRDELWDAVLGERSAADVDADLLGLLSRADPTALPALHVSCGDEDELLVDSDRFVEVARGVGADVTSSRVAGGHDWAVWDRLVQDVLAWLPLAGAARTGSAPTARGGVATPVPGAGRSTPDRHPITPVDLSTAGFVGTLPRGELDRPRVVTSVADAARLLGVGPGAGPLADAITLFFANGGRRAVVVRTPAADAETLLGSAADGTGVHALGPTGVGAVCIPELATTDDPATAWGAVRRWCSSHGAVLLVDPPPGSTSAAALRSWGETAAPRHPDAAAYGPWLRVEDAAGGRDVAPSGAIAGIVARTDHARGVWKAPAGTDATVVGVVGPVTSLPAADLGLVASADVNPLRLIRQRPTVWGARTLADDDDPATRYLPVRRLELLLRRSLAEGLRWTATASNTQPLWEEVRADVEEFLAGLFRAGAFAGRSLDEAVTVAVGRSTTTRADLDRGVVVLRVGFAPVRPAEFVVIELELRALGT